MDFFHEAENTKLTRVGKWYKIAGADVPHLHNSLVPFGLTP